MEAQDSNCVNELLFLWPAVYLCGWNQSNERGGKTWKCRLMLLYLPFFIPPIDKVLFEQNWKVHFEKKRERPTVTEMGVRYGPGVQTSSSPDSADIVRFMQFFSSNFSLFYLGGKISVTANCYSIADGRRATEKMSFIEIWEYNSCLKLWCRANKKDCSREPPTAGVLGRGGVSFRKDDNCNVCTWRFGDGGGDHEDSIILVWLAMYGMCVWDWKEQKTHTHARAHTYWYMMKTQILWSTVPSNFIHTKPPNVEKSERKHIQKRADPPRISNQIDVPGSVFGSRMAHVREIQTHWTAFVENRKCVSCSC